jgi:hypothetical protein
MPEPARETKGAQLSIGALSRHRHPESFESDRLSHALPVPDMVALTRDLGARALALSVSTSGRKPRTAALVRHVRGMLPRRTALLVGGEGAPPPFPGVQVFADLRNLEGWVREIGRT